MSGDQQREAVARAIYSLGGYSEQVWEDIDPDLRAQVLRDADVVLSALAPVAADEIEGRIWAWLNRYDAPWSPSDAKVRDLASDIAALTPMQPDPLNFQSGSNLEFAGSSQPDREALRALIYDRTLVALVDAQALADAILAAGFRRVHPDPLRAGVETLVRNLGHDEFDGTLDLDGLRIADRLRALLAETEAPRGE